MNIHAFSRSVAVATVLLAAPALAEQFGPLELSGFAKEEFSSCDNCSRGLVNPSGYDPRGVLPGNPAVNQPGPSGHGTSNLGIAMLTVGLSHEFDNAWKIEGKASARERNNGPDIYGHYMIDLYAGISHPQYGSLTIGDQSTRSWSRSDSFAYPMGLSVPWAESGAGYSIVPLAIRYGTKQFALPIGKIRFEATYGTAKRRGPLNASSATVAAPDPHLVELFVQYSNEQNLIELIHQTSTGGVQSSFAKGAFYGVEGDTNPLSAATPYKAPSENVSMAQGTHWFNPAWKLTYGLKRSEWSGQQQQCDYGPTSPVASNCFWDQGGFNYWSDGGVHHAIEWDWILGGVYSRGLYNFTLGTVRMNKAYVHVPSATEWGQNNTATFLNLGIYRKLPEIYRNLEVYGGIGRVMFGRQGPAPLSDPANNGDSNVDPRTSKSVNSVTIGANLLF